MTDTMGHFLWKARHIDIWTQQQQQQQTQSNEIAAVPFVNGKLEIQRVVEWCWNNAAAEVKLAVIRYGPYQAVPLWLNCFISAYVIYAKGEH